MSGCGLPSPVGRTLANFSVQPARAAFVAKACQPIDPGFLLQQTPGPDRVVVQQQNPGDRRVAHAVIQQNQRIRTARQPIGRQTIPRRLAKPNRILTESG